MSYRPYLMNGYCVRLPFFRSLLKRRWPRMSQAMTGRQPLCRLPVILTLMRLLPPAARICRSVNASIISHPCAELTNKGP